MIRNISINDKHLTKFKELTIGETFVYNDDLCIRINDNQEDINVFNFEQNIQMTIYKDTLVRVVTINIFEV